MTARSRPRMKMIRRLPLSCLALSLLLVLPGCLTPRWAQPVNPFMNDDGDRGHAALKARDYVMALEFYGRLVEEKPDDMTARYQLALVNQEVGRLDDAYGLYRIVYVSGSEDDTPLLNGGSTEEPLFQSAERQLMLLSGRLGKDTELRDMQAERARRIAAEQAQKEAAKKKAEQEGAPAATGCSIRNIGICPH